MPCSLRFVEEDGKNNCKIKRGNEGESTRGFAEKRESMFSRSPARPTQREDAPKRSETRRRLRDHVTPLANRAARPLDIQSRLSIE